MANYTIEDVENLILLNDLLFEQNAQLKRVKAYPKEQVDQIVTCNETLFQENSVLKEQEFNLEKTVLRFATKTVDLLNEALGDEK